MNTRPYKVQLDIGANDFHDGSESVINYANAEGCIGTAGERNSSTIDITTYQLFSYLIRRYVYLATNCTLASGMGHDENIPICKYIRDKKNISSSLYYSTRRKTLV